MFPQPFVSPSDGAGVTVVLAGGIIYILTFNNASANDFFSAFFDEDDVAGFTGSLCCNDSISAIPRMRSGVLFQKVIELCRCAQQCCRLYFQRIGDVIEHLKRKGFGYTRSLD